MSWKNIIIFLLAGAVIFLVFFGHTCRPDFSETKSKPEIIVPAKIVAPVVTREKSDSVKIDSLTRIAKSLSRSADAIKLSYAAAKLYIAQIHDSMQNTIDLLPEENDYAGGSKQILNDQLQLLHAENKKKDSLCDDDHENSTQQLALKDSIIRIQDSGYAFLRRSFDVSIDENVKLIDYSKQLEKQLRKKKVGNFFWKAAAIGAGLFILKDRL